MNEASREFLVDLHDKMSRYFNSEEIETLAFRLFVDYDTLRGATKPTKINSLIYEVARGGRLEELLNEVRRQRSNVSWPVVPTDFSLPQGAGGSETDGATIYQIGTLNTGGGAFIGGGIQAGGDVEAGQKSVAGDEIKGSKYVMSGDFRGAILNIESRLDNVTQRVGTASGVAPDQHQELERLIADLKGVLANVAPAQMPDAETLARRVGALAEEATAPNPDREAVAELGEIVRRAAGKLAPSVPGLAKLVATIVELVSSIAL